METLPPARIVGRSVTFAGGNPDEALALARYEAGFARLGFTDIRYAYEPVGAAFFFARPLKQDAERARRRLRRRDQRLPRSCGSSARSGELRSTALARSGVGVAGDAFDYRIIDQLVSPELGKGEPLQGVRQAACRSRSATTPPSPGGISWPCCAPPRTCGTSAPWSATAMEPEKIARLIEVLDDNHGYALYRSVSALKEALSSQDEATFRFEAGSVLIEKAVKRTDFEGWIAPELKAIETAVDQALERRAWVPTASTRCS